MELLVLAVIIALAIAAWIVISKQKRTHTTAAPAGEVEAAQRNFLLIVVHCFGERRWPITAEGLPSSLAGCSSAAHISRMFAGNYWNQ